MTQFLRAGIAAFLLSTLAGVVACKKESAPQPTPVVAPAKGELIGHVQPAGAVLRVGATKDGLTTTVIPDAAGAFRFDSLVVGTYTVQVTPRAGFLTPGYQVTTVTANVTVDMGLVQLESSVQAGTLRGRFAPAGALRTVSALNEASLQTISTTVAASDTVFLLYNLPAGTYTITFEAASGYVAPSPQQHVTMTANDMFDLGRFQIAPQPANTPVVSFRVNGTLVTATQWDARLPLDYLSVEAGTASQKIGFFLEGVTGTGTYPLIGLSSATYRFISPAGTAVWTAGGSAASGTVVISTFDAVAKKISGTFQFSPSPTSGGASGSRNITSGVFANLPYR